MLALQPCSGIQFPKPGLELARNHAKSGDAEIATPTDAHEKHGGESPGVRIDTDSGNGSGGGT
ncbi:MAG TPA: hypothetical protein VM657_13960 [Sphingomonas sp.]|nr:hypothetical protein [Sphingomonas sp.]